MNLEYRLTYLWRRHFLIFSFLIINNELSLIYNTLFYCYRAACGFESSGKFVITGGWKSTRQKSALKTVTRYSRTGEAELLPELNVARAFHACGAFLTDDGATVSWSYLIFHKDNDNNEGSSCNRGIQRCWCRPGLNWDLEDWSLGDEYTTAPSFVSSLAT